MTYKPPLKQIENTLFNICDLEEICKYAPFDDFDKDLILQIVQSGAKFASEVVEPTNRIGDKEGATLIQGHGVRLPDCFRGAYEKMVEGGWQGISFDAQLGGMGLPSVVGLAVFETIHSANMAFGLCSMLTMGALDALKEHGTKAQQEEYLPKLLSGEWSGTMNLTEPQAGSDVGALTTRATNNFDGTYTIQGQKIFITWGDHDLAENIIHLVLARLPGAPSGPKGISLFIVPKFLKNENGIYDIRNDAGAVSLEHKLGIHASPTCVMAYGEGLFGKTKGAIGYLIGNEMGGMAAMFTMMNAARLNVGLQGVAVAEAATQKAIAFAKDRIQGKISGATQVANGAIIGHPDVARMLLFMRAKTNAARAICYLTAGAADFAKISDDINIKSGFEARAAFLTPIAKAWSTDVGVEVASIGIQVHGGMGYIEETGAAQLLRDARITPIYEGTNGIQAIDLIGRKMRGDGGKAFYALIGEMRQLADNAKTSKSEFIGQIAASFANSINSLEEAGNQILKWQSQDNSNLALLSASCFLTLAGNVIGGHALLLAEFKNEQQASEHNLQQDRQNDQLILQFYFANIMVKSDALFQQIKSSQEYNYDFDE